MDKVLTSITKTTTIVEYDWKNIPVGSKFTAIIKGRKTKGLIQKYDKKIYLCQSVYNGNSCPNKLGYKYSYRINDGSNDSLKSEYVQNLKVTLNPYFVEIPTLRAGDREVFINKGYITVGCTKVTNKEVIDIFCHLMD